MSNQTGSKRGRKKAEPAPVDLGTMEMGAVSCQIVEGTEPQVAPDEFVVQGALGVFKNHPDIVTPEYKTSGSACFDLAAGYGAATHVRMFSPNNMTGTPVRSAIRQMPNGHRFIVIPPRHRVLIPTGLHFDIAVGYKMLIYSRSGHSFETGLCLTNSVAVIDSDYVDEVFISVINLSDSNVAVYDGDRVAQAEVTLSDQFSIVEMDRKPRAKGTRVGGFGSTGR